jgi:hypothetical protein
MDDDFNSSDVEFDGPPPNPWAKAGAASIQEMLDHAIEDRLASKKASKALTLQAENPKTEYQDSLWLNRFHPFRTGTLKVK